MEYPAEKQSHTIIYRLLRSLLVLRLRRSRMEAAGLVKSPMNSWLEDLPQ
jgi:hypothetical protein